MASFYRTHGKRTFDLLVAVPLLIVISPILLLIAVLVRIKLGSPVFFVQRRTGRNAEGFRIYKFRTMTNRCDASGTPLPDADRLTRFGQFLRNTSLDELPELWNVIQGDMSLVGPRPLLVKYLPLYTPQQVRRHEVTPGITGWAQVNGRNQLSWESRFQLDVWYVDYCSLWVDCKILCRTLLRVLCRSGITARNHVTSPEFQGSCHVIDNGIAVIGAGGHAKTVIAAIQAAGHSISGIYDDDQRRWGQSVLGVPVRGPVSRLAEQPLRMSVIAIGDNQVRQRLARSLNLRWITVVHPTALVHSSVRLGNGTVVLARAVIQPDTTIGEHAIINTAASVDHDCQLASYVHVGPGSVLAGSVRLAAGVFLGTGVSVIPGVNIDADAVVGAGSVVIESLPGGVVAAGSPAQIKSRVDRGEAA